MSKEVSILYLGNQLSKHGFTPTSVETLGYRLKEDFTVIRGSHFRNPVIRLLHMCYLTLRHRKSDLLLIDTYSTWAFVYAAITAGIARIVRMPYVPILHGGNLPERAKKSPFWMRLFLKKARAVVCPSAYLLDEIYQFYPRDYKLIPNYIDIEHYPFRLRRVGIPIKLLWVRSFHEIYHPKLAVEIVHSLKDHSYEVNLSMVGPDKDGSLETIKKYALEKGVHQLIEFTGRLSKTEWISLADSFDIFINTTNVDNTPVSVMEAMALGFPVISTNVGGMPYLIDNGVDGILVPPNDAASFVEQIVKLYKYPEDCRQISINARKKAEQWDWNIIKQQWIQLIKGESFPS